MRLLFTRITNHVFQEPIDASYMTILVMFYINWVTGKSILVRNTEIPWYATFGSFKFLTALVTCHHPAHSRKTYLTDL